MLNLPHRPSGRQSVSGWALAGLVLTAVLPLCVTAQTSVPAEEPSEAPQAAPTEERAFGITSRSFMTLPEERRSLPPPPAIPEPSPAFMMMYSIVWNGWALVEEDLFARTAIAFGAERILESRGRGIVSPTPPVQRRVQVTDPRTGEQIEGVETLGVGAGHPAMTEQLLSEGFPYLWLIREGRPFVIRDAETLARGRELLDSAHEAFRELQDLGRQQLRSGRAQEELGAELADVVHELGELGQRRGGVAMQQIMAARGSAPDPQARLQALDEEAQQIGERQQTLLQEQARLTALLQERQEEQRRLAARQEELLDETRGVIERTREEMWRLIDRAREDGLADSLS